MTYGKAVDRKDPGPETNEKSLGPIYGPPSARPAPRVTRSSKPSPTHPWRQYPKSASPTHNFRPVAPVYTPESFFDESDFQRVFNTESAS